MKNRRPLIFIDSFASAECGQILHLVKRGSKESPQESRNFETDTGDISGGTYEINDSIESERDDTTDKRFRIENSVNMESSKIVPFSLYTTSGKPTKTEEVLIYKLAVVFAGENSFNTKCDRIARVMGNIHFSICTTKRSHL